MSYIANLLEQQLADTLKFQIGAFQCSMGASCKRKYLDKCGGPLQDSREVGHPSCTGLSNKPAKHLAFLAQHVLHLRLKSIAGLVLCCCKGETLVDEDFIQLTVPQQVKEVACLFGATLIGNEGEVVEAKAMGSAGKALVREQPHLIAHHQMTRLSFSSRFRIKCACID